MLLGAGARDHLIPGPSLLLTLRPRNTSRMEIPLANEKNIAVVGATGAQGGGLVRAFIKFNKGMMKMPVHWRLWVMGLVAFNMVAPLFFIDRVEAQIVLGVFLASGLLMTALTARTGFTRVLGLGHFLWIPLLYFLATRVSLVPAGDAFGFWIRGLIVVNAVSLVMDVADVIRYVAGDRADTIEGL